MTNQTIPHTLVHTHTRTNTHTHTHRNKLAQVNGGIKVRLYEGQVSYISKLLSNTHSHNHTRVHTNIGISQSMNFVKFKFSQLPRHFRKCLISANACDISNQRI